MRDKSVRIPVQKSILKDLEALEEIRQFIAPERYQMERYRIVCEGYLRAASAPPLLRLDYKTAPSGAPTLGYKTTPYGEAA